MTHHNFDPQSYHTTIGPHEPVLRMESGDRVTTKSVDAHGHDERGEKVADRGNPMTGPFYVNGARPGDTLAVTFEAVRPNRKTGFTKPRIAPSVLDPGVCVASEEGVDYCTWTIDLGAGTARMSEPSSQLSDLVLPLEPMLGCFGVAPENHQAISTATSGRYGGNMDYRGFGPGATVYLPVSEPGALFFLGDGHAIQGDGEIVGTGIEVSMDVTFRVELRQDWPVRWPRAESDEQIMTVGNARPLDQGLQHATTEMVRWLETDFGLKPLASHALLGQCVRYDVGNVYDPAYTIVCKLRKALLPG